MDTSLTALTVSELIEIDSSVWRGKQQEMEAVLERLSTKEKVDLALARLRARYLRVRSCEPSSDLMLLWKASMYSGPNICLII